MDVESGRLRGWRLASSVTPPSLALGLPFGNPGITGNGRAGVTLAASCRARAPVLDVGDKIGRPPASLCLLCWELELWLSQSWPRSWSLSGRVECVLRIRFNQLDQRVSEDEPTYGIHSASPANGGGDGRSRETVLGTGETDY